jgi:hypothetical protein
MLALARVSIFTAALISCGTGVFNTDVWEQ